MLCLFTFYAFTILVFPLCNLLFSLSHSSFTLETDLSSEMKICSSVRKYVGSLTILIPLGTLWILSLWQEAGCFTGLFFFFLIVVDFVIHWNETAMGLHVFPIPIPPSHLPLHPIPLGLPSAPGPSACLMHPKYYLEEEKQSCRNWASWLQIVLSVQRYSDQNSMVLAQKQINGKGQERSPSLWQRRLEYTMEKRQCLQ